MNVMLTLAKIYCHFVGHDLEFSGIDVVGRTGRIGVKCLNGCGFDYPQVTGEPGEGY